MGNRHLLVATVILFGLIVSAMVSQAQEKLAEDGTVESQQRFQQSDSTKIIASHVNEPPRAPETYIPPHDWREIALSLLVLAFGVILTLLQHRVLLKRPGDISQEGILVLHSVTLIVVATLFLITAGYTERQVAPAMGLFGTIIGYILGRRSRPSGVAVKNPRSYDNKENLS